VKYLLFLLLASIASLEFFHELANGNTSGASICTTPQAMADGVGDILRQHLVSH